MNHDPYDPCASRTVQPLTLAAMPNERPIIAVDDSTALSERTGQTVKLDRYIADLRLCPPSLVVTYSPETLLYRLHQRWENYPDWTWRVSVTTKHGRPLLLRRVAYFGFKRTKNSNARSITHLVIDANSFFRNGDKGIGDLLTFGIELRAWCNRHGLKLRAGAAGIAAQLLRHPNFYPEARRQVPDFINREVRPRVPGNHYDCFTDAFQRYHGCTYIDQQAAFHYAASKTPLPNGNSILAHGYSRRQDKEWAPATSRLYTHARRKHGLVRAMVNVPPPVSNTRFAPHVMQESGQRIAHLWTNEIPYLESLGLTIEYLVAVWGTSEIDKGIKLYAEWAQREQLQHPWLKALLLMPYGLLARHAQDMTLHHPDGDVPMLIANQLIPNTKTRTVHAKPETANVLQLGLIQAYVRALSLDMARQMNADSHEVLSIYADGIFVRAGKGEQLPLVTPWRVKEEYAQIELADAMRFPGSRKLRRSWAQYEKQLQEVST